MTQNHFLTEKKTSLQHSECCSGTLSKGENGRNPFWDAAKAVLIFLVVYGHSIQFIIPEEAAASFWDSVPFKFIYLFHMPLFMLISGYFAGHSIIRKGFPVLGKYGKRLLLPILSYSLLVIISNLFSTGTSLKQVAVACLLTSNAHAWFLSAVFICTCFLWAYTCTKTLVGKIFCGFFPILLFLLIQTHPPISKFFGIGNQITYLWPFFLLGHCLKQHHFDSENIPKWWLVFVPITIAIAFLCDKSLFVYNTPLNRTWYGLGINLLRTAAAICGCMAFCACIRCCQKWLNSAFILKLGQATLAIYLLQTIFFSYCSKPIQETHIISNEAAAFVFAGILTATTFVFYFFSRKIKWVRLLLYGETFH